jgi:hypothetical protein
MVSPAFTQIEAMWCRCGRFGHKMIHGPDNQIFVFGGSTAAVRPGQNDVSMEI